MAEHHHVLLGGCFCGNLRYRVDAVPRFVIACHCTDCQKFSASAFSLSAIIPTRAFGVTSQTQLRGIDKTADNGAISTRFVCPDCATWISTQTTSSTELMIVRPSSLDDHSWVQPVAQLFTRSALPWALMPLPLSYETEFTGGDFGPTEAVYAASGIGPGSAPSPATHARTS